MKKILLIAGIACIAATQANAMMPRPYVSAKARWSFMDNKWEYKETYNYKSQVNKENVSIDDSVLGGSLALGMRVPLVRGAWRNEIEYSINDVAKKKRTDEDGAAYKLKLNSQALLFNTYFDINTNSPFEPYIGAGLGVSSLKASVDEDDPSDNESYKNNTNFAWQVGAGVVYNLNRNIDLDFGYRYIDYGHFTKKKTKIRQAGEKYESNKIRARAHEIGLGLRYLF